MLTDSKQTRIRRAVHAYFARQSTQPFNALAT